MNAPRCLSLQICLLVAAAALAPLPADASQRDTPGDLVVALEPGTSIEAINERYGTETLERIPGTTTYRVRASRSRKALKRLKKDRSVRAASRDGVVRRHQTVGFPNDTPDLIDPNAETSPEQVYHDQLGETGQLEALQVDSASVLTESGDAVTVAVLDTGIALEHPAFANKLWTNPGETPGNGIDDDGNGYVDDVNGWDFVGNEPDVEEEADAGPVSGHGTFIAGLIALTAPKARIMPLRVLDPYGEGSAFDAAEAINYAVQHGAKVVSMSFGSDERKPPRVLADAIRSARELGVVLVAAVGNDASDVIPYPASDTDSVISVGASDPSQNRAAFSNYAPDAVDVWAPGTELVSAMPGVYPDGRPRYARWSGTSFSTALVASACSALLATAAISDPEQVRDRLANTGPDLEDGSGKQVNFFEAVGSILRDAGALDVWSAAPFSAPESQSGAGYVLLRTIGQAERLTAYAWDLEPYAHYDFYVVPVENQGQLIKVNVDGPIEADQFGGIKFVAASAVRPNDPTPPLPLPLDRIWGVAFVDVQRSALALGAVVDRDSEYVAVWAGVGLAPAVPGTPEAPFGRAWLGFDPQNDGAYQAFDVATCLLESETEYALVINGREVVRAFSTDDGGGVGSIDFYFSSDPDEIARGARELSETTTPDLFPVTRIEQVVIMKVEPNGQLTPVIGGSFSGAGKMLPRRR